MRRIAAYLIHNAAIKLLDGRGAPDVTRRGGASEKLPNRLRDCH
jgi:hypothetical protein